MLGRLRMSVRQALAAYTEFGNQVFGKSRYWHINSALWYPRSKYASSPMEKVFSELISRQLDIRDPGEATDETFESSEDQTRTIVFSWRQSRSVSKPYLWRSYHHRSRMGGQDNKFHLNLGPAANIPIYEVARATSAAPRYFEPIVINRWTHVDGALGANNPSPQTINEVYSKENERVPALSVSIGTGVNLQDQDEGTDFSERMQQVLQSRKSNKLRRRQILGKQWELLTGVARQTTDTEAAVVNWERDCKLFQRAGFPNQEDFEPWWHRLNVDNTLKAIPLDDWTPRKGGKETLQQITNLTSEYLAKQHVQDTIARIAQVLVDKRRRRVWTEKWEHFVMKVAYRCPKSKGHTEQFNSREDLRTHLQAKHDHATLTEAEMHKLLNKARVVPSQS
ncbi:hypothetical protein PG997_014686 [Apiospora hydei]|uniref:PNPLA domain-containing protein n=1 Tax=Apiospora hydei TaxID=1337664 RepID=A0ABR1UUJ5_9PEZI